MRRLRQELGQAECEEVLRRRKSGVLCLVGDGGYPYGVPMSHIYYEGKLWFHCALSGHKLDAIGRGSKCCFTVIDRDEIISARFTTAYRSVIAFGQIRPVNDEAVRQHIGEAIGRMLCPDESPEALQAELDAALHRCVILEMTIDHLTGKIGKELLSAGIPT